MFYVIDPCINNLIDIENLIQKEEIIWFLHHYPAANINLYNWELMNFILC